ncbi:MAG TPA: hypothetical protein DCE33_13615, partial [Rhodospirillaceae bacterium]|nr:hypothetical protein [Rhodospirillaceae bacterium]
MRRIPVPTSNLYRSVTERLVRFTARAFAILVTTAFVVAETNNSFADPIDPRALLAQNVVPSVETPAATAVPDVRLSPFASPTRNTKVALLLPLSGPQAALGQAMLEAAQLAMFEMATDQFTLHPIDTRGTPEGARSAADQAIQDGVSLILGPLLANSVRSVAPVAGRVGLNVVAF